MASVTSQAITAVIRRGPEPRLKALGFKKAARSFWKEQGGLYKVIQFQSSIWNSPESARFTINIGVTTACLHEIYMGRSFPRNPGSAVMAINARIGHLLPIQEDFWWEVTPESPLDSVASEVAEAVTKYAVPFLDGYSQLDQVTAQVASGCHLADVHPVLCEAILWWCTGATARATAIVQQLKAERVGTPFLETIEWTEARMHARGDEPTPATDG